MKEEIKVTELIDTFRDMAERGTLLARGGVSQGRFVNSDRGNNCRSSNEINQ